MNTQTYYNINVYFFICFFSVTLCDSKKYDNYTLYRGIPVDDLHLNFYQNLTREEYVNFWRPPGTLFKPVDFIVDPQKKENFMKDVQKFGLYVTTIIEDVQKAFDKQLVKTYVRRNMDTFDWNHFYRLDDIYQWLKDLVRTHSTEMELIPIGTTHERREILAVKIILRGSLRRSKVIVEGGIHAREWISPAFVTYLINEIIHAPKSHNFALKDVAMTYEWYFVPVLNPDGYEYSHTNDRVWRKNRRRDGGVDLNRNFDHAFGTTGVSYRKNSDIYCGSKAFSEPESRSMAKFIQSKGDNVEYYLAFHSYGQYMILPYANLKIHTENFVDVYKMCLQAKSKIAIKYKTRYTVGTAFDTVGYLTSGVSGCWVKHKLRVPYVITFELRDDGRDGFSLPPEKILPTCRETMDGIVDLLRPRTSAYTKLQCEPTNVDGAVSLFILDKVVIVFNVMLFIIVRFD